LKPLSISLLLAALFGMYLLSEREEEHAEGTMIAPDEPRQNPATASAWDAGGYRFKPVASYRIRARVLLAERYWMGRESDLSPLDLTLGWGPMSDTALLRQFRI
jgi:hypothetical protein